MHDFSINVYGELGINPLTDAQRESAYERARVQIAGREPQFEQFQKVRFQKYSPLVMRTISGLSVVALLAAFAPSAMRLHAVALATNLQILQDATSAYVAALATVLSAETGQVIFSLAQSAATGKWQKRFLWLGVAVCTLIAFAGNAAAFGMHLQFNLDALANSIFAYLEAFAPPLLVLIIAQVLKAQILQGDANRTSAHANYESALQRWQSALATATDAPNWRRELANALRDALRDANKQSKARLRMLTREQWVLLVEAEQMQSEWYVQPMQLPAPVVQPVEQVQVANVHVQKKEQPIAKQPSGGGGSSGTGEVDAMTAHAKVHGDVLVLDCPYCGKQMQGATELRLKRAVSAHLRGCKSRGVNLAGTEDDTVEVIAAEVE